MSVTSLPPHRFYAPLAIGAPDPYREPPSRLERVVHFIPPHVDKVREKIGDLIAEADVVLGNLEDGVPAENKVDAREALISILNENDFGSTGAWARINSFDSPWGLEDVERLVAEAGNSLDVLMIPKADGPWDIHYIDRFLAQLEARHQIQKPIMLHLIIETAMGISNIEALAGASPRLHGMSLGPADLAASRNMKTTRVGGGSPSYVVPSPPAEGETYDENPARFLQDPWHYALNRIVDACASYGLKAFYGPFGDFGDPVGCEAQFRAAFFMGCAGAWSLHPSQIEIAKRVYSPSSAQVKLAKRIIAAMPEGGGVAMVDGKMQDDATWKQAKIIVDLAEKIVAKEPDKAETYR